MLCMKGRIIFSILVETVGTVLGLLFLRGFSLYTFIALSALTLLLILFTGKMDPGTLARRNSEYYSMALFGGYSYKNIQKNGAIAGRSFEKKGRVLHSEVFCNTCGIFRPAGTSHCRACDRCISVMDHHCVWLSNCIGENNYPFFMNLLSVETARAGVLLSFRFQQTFPVLEASLSSFYFYSTLFGTCILSAFVAMLFLYFMWLSLKGVSSRAFCKNKTTHASK
ncbi:hypothetical protein NEMIN01_0735 [Nematocida minor]|uniref:uncharacterized protein n=1 Tax=Nematocida minor TaxID=1912983 RepID=UPI002220ABC9|nr:uncharacterized protein NEMIN01_0735 [Nematocida minor]KAI5189872.1 hypothetical protein NEMIN01_0735 [Nematocida minor]